ncbi:MAG: hypothetical protein U0235_00195 [Polyangiaceae bacterium]
MSISAAILSLAAVACGGATSGADNGSPPESEDELATGKAALYDCHGGGGSGNSDSLVRFELLLGKSNAKITDLSKEAVAPGTGKIDSSYAPSSSEYKDATRFVGFDTIDVADDVARIDLMVSKEIRESAASGRIWLRLSGPEGGSKWTYTCNKKAKPIAVDTSVKSRLSCSLLPMMCTDDNPPGQTCLSDAFVNQKDDDAADMRFTYLDHFGVHVVERKDQVGASSALSRSKTSFTGKWDKTELKLDYRAGITYTGTLKVDGKSTKVKCNDLAMLD